MVARPIIDFSQWLVWGRGGQGGVDIISGRSGRVAIHTVTALVDDQNFTIDYQGHLHALVGYIPLSMDQYIQQY